MNRQQQQRHSSQNCQICHKSIQSDRYLTHQTQCLIQQIQRRTQQQQDQRPYYYQQQRQPQQRINNSRNYNRNNIILQNQDSSDNNQDIMSQFPNFSSIFGPNSQFQRSMENMRQQMNEAFNFNLNFDSNSFQFNVNSNIGQRQHVQIRNIGQEQGNQIQQFFNLPNIQFYYGNDDNHDGDRYENYFYQHQEPQIQDNRQPQAMSSSDINQIPIQKYKPNQKNQNCVICMIDFQKFDNVKILSCLHQFHAKCIDQWLQQKGECPICRHQIN